MKISKQLKSSSADLWNKAISHPFTQELGRGTLSGERFRRYFLQDYVFVNDLVKMTGVAVSKAPSLPLARPIDEFLSNILGAEDAFFVGAFETLGIAESEYRKVSPLPTTAALGNFLVRLAYEGSFTDICCAMLVTEGVYLDWGESLRDAHPEESGSEFGKFYRGWIELHTQETLGPMVNHLAAVVDMASATEIPKLQMIFDRALRYEVAFWRMAYDDEEWPI